MDINRYGRMVKMIDILINTIIVLAKCTGLLLMIVGFVVALYIVIRVILSVKELYKNKGNKDE